MNKPEAIEAENPSPSDYAKWREQRSGGIGDPTYTLTVDDVGADEQKDEEGDL